MTDARDHPSDGRVLAGMIAAGAAAPAAAVLSALMMYDPWALSVWDIFHLIFVFFYFGIPVALGHAGLLALPFYVILRKRWALRWWNAVAGGFVVGMLPLALLSLGPVADSARIGDQMTVVSGRYTAVGWRFYFETVIYAGGYGAVGGFAFWFVVGRLGRIAQSGSGT